MRLKILWKELIYTRKMPKKQAAEVGRHYLEKVGLLHKQHQYPQSLSGGQKQRVGIARFSVKPGGTLAG